MKNQKGFTLIELMVVVVIIAVIAAIVLSIARGGNTNEHPRSARSADKNVELVEPIPVPATPPKEQQ